MSATQPAVVNFGPAPHSVELREVPVPEIGVDDVLLEVDAVGVCGSDLHTYRAPRGGTVASLGLGGGGSPVIAALIALRRFRLRMQSLSLASRHSPHQQTRERVDYERDYEQYQPQLYERVLMQLGLRFVEFVRDG